MIAVQAFYNTHLHSDIFNHANIHFWEYAQPGYDTFGFISCTGEKLPPKPMHAAAFVVLKRSAASCGGHGHYLQHL